MMGLYLHPDAIGHMLFYTDHFRQGNILCELREPVVEVLYREFPISQRPSPVDRMWARLQAKGKV